MHDPNGGEMMQAGAVRNERGIPPNIKPPRNTWETHTQICPLGHWFAMDVERRRYADIRGLFTGGAFVHKWWSWRVTVCVAGRSFYLWRWRERWAD